MLAATATALVRCSFCLTMELRLLKEADHMAHHTPLLCVMPVVTSVALSWMLAPKIESGNMQKKKRKWPSNMQKTDFPHSVAQ